MRLSLFLFYISWNHLWYSIYFSSIPVLMQLKWKNSCPNYGSQTFIPWPLLQSSYILKTAAARRYRSSYIDIKGSNANIIFRRILRRYRTQLRRSLQCLKLVKVRSALFYLCTDIICIYKKFITKERGDCANFFVTKPKKNFLVFVENCKTNT